MTHLNKCKNCKMYRTPKDEWRVFCSDECIKLYSQRKEIDNKRDKWEEGLYARS